MNSFISLLKEVFFVLLGIGLIIYAGKLGKAFIASDIAFRQAMNIAIKDSEKQTLKALKVSIIISGLVIMLSGVLSFFEVIHIF